MPAKRGTLPQSARAKAASNYPGSTWAALEDGSEAVQWAWPGWLPRGFLTVLASEPGAGKSSLCLRLAACYTAGQPWPDGSAFAGQRGRVLWCEGEAGHRLNLDRVRRWGIDPNHIVSPLDDPWRNFRLDNSQHMSALVAHAHRDDIGLIVLDSLSGILSHNSSAHLTSTFVTFLTGVARSIGKPVLLTHHLRKRTTRDRDGLVSLDRLRGSSGIGQVARVVWALSAPDPAEPTYRLLSVIKNNLSAPPPPLGMTMNDEGLHFSPPPQPAGATSELGQAMGFLRDLLAAGSLPATHVMAQAKAANLSIPTLRRAKKELCIQSRRPAGKSEWYWELPSHQS
jgi:hypothetical protein